MKQGSKKSTVRRVGATKKRKPAAAAVRRERSWLLLFCAVLGVCVAVGLGALWLDSHTGRMQRVINRMERECESLTQTYGREMAVWKKMVTPEALKRELARRNVDMVLPEPEQVVEFSTL